MRDINNDTIVPSEAPGGGASAPTLSETRADHAHGARLDDPAAERVARYVVGLHSSPAPVAGVSVQEVVRALQDQLATRTEVEDLLVTWRRGRNIATWEVVSAQQLAAKHDIYCHGAVVVRGGMRGRPGRRDIALMRGIGSRLAAIGVKLDDMLLAGENGVFSCKRRCKVA